MEERKIDAKIPAPGLFLLLTFFWVRPCAPFLQLFLVCPWGLSLGSVLGVCPSDLPFGFVPRNYSLRDPSSWPPLLIQG